MSKILSLGFGAAPLGPSVLRSQLGSWMSFAFKQSSRLGKHMGDWGKSPTISVFSVRTAVQRHS